ncbi:hypothetical protein CHLNCDRAFT_141671 [Chlorella variabilis]|uniref:Rhodanese domain-containing protein n=1 Tax=Chlorella variabilis TaxID=554065 RepID=E1ZTC3_CHLVA|nr:hypothetical protein CHLNCDRAFT_141671 [Chlorella variabilis]EFN50908.1 hypothetical protein CHLNCDRAFT_141671 [Chlorella variabilis]|eukprot:XP_005843010.1 hypothetical protein CHLNCDRAFT_141671 [Chlorella variabilis]
MLQVCSKFVPALAATHTLLAAAGVLAAGSLLPPSWLAAAAATAAQPAPEFPLLVSPELLKQNLGEVKLLDAAWHLGSPGQGAADFQRERIPGARFFDLDLIADTSTGLQSMLPGTAAFDAAADALRVTPASVVVVYDHGGLLTAPRAWWTWHVLGHRRVAVLDGGLAGWKAARGEVDTSPVSAQLVAAPADSMRRAPLRRPRYRAHLRAGEVRDWRAMLANVESREEQVVDARPSAKYRGDMPEGGGLRAGHIPGALNLPVQGLLRGGKFRSPEELRAVFGSADVDLSRPLVAYCATGIMASAVVLAARLAAPDGGGAATAVYDGSWQEWGGLAGAPVATCPPPFLADPLLLV